jgi:diaminopimelate decarboxylase
MQDSTLFGMTCDGMDIIAKNINVPSTLRVGDWLCVSGMGAYTYGCRSNFNGMKSTERIIRWQKVEQPIESAQPAFSLAQ